MKNCVCVLVGGYTQCDEGEWGVFVTTPTRPELKLQTRQRESGKPLCVSSFSTSFFVFFISKLFQIYLLLLLLVRVS
jgi:hypothetical protein